MSDIPGWFDWHTLYRDAVAQATDGAHFVECGTFFGKSADFLAREIFCSGKQIRFDTWDNYLLAPPGWDGGAGPTYLGVKRTLAGLPVAVRIGDALAASVLYANDSLDLVYLDDDHSTDHVLRECRAWWPKVKPGGMMAGHDYDWPTVVSALTTWSAETGLTIVTVCTRSWLVRKG